MEKVLKKSVHEGHRKRVKARFIKEGNLDSFEYHQILELLLFYAIPRKDTNVIAHKLLDEYGSFHNLLNSKPEDIMKRCGLTENAAVLLSLIPHLSRKYLNSCWQNENGKVINTLSAASDYFNSLLAGKPFESFYMLCLDSNKRLKQEIKISDGNSDSSPIYLENIVSSALLHNASFVIIGHNHPAGTNKPSSADINVTMKIKAAFEPLDIVVIDHIIVCGEKNYSFAQKGLCNLRYNV